jgi:hypothetical protein
LEAEAFGDALLLLLAVEWAAAADGAHKKRNADRFPHPRSVRR